MRKKVSFVPANRWRRDKTPPELITGSDLPCPIQRNVLVPRREKRLLRFSFPRSLPSSFFTAVFLIDRGEEEGETHIAIRRKCAGGGQFPIQTFFFRGRRESRNGTSNSNITYVKEVIIHVKYCTTCRHHCEVHSAAHPKFQEI